MVLSEMLLEVVVNIELLSGLLALNVFVGVDGMLCDTPLNE